MINMDIWSRVLCLIQLPLLILLVNLLQSTEGSIAIQRNKRQDWRQQQVLQGQQPFPSNQGQFGSTFGQTQSTGGLSPNVGSQFQPPNNQQSSPWANGTPQNTDGPGSNQPWQQPQASLASNQTPLWNQQQGQGQGQGPFGGQNQGQNPFGSQFPFNQQPSGQSPWQLGPGVAPGQGPQPQGTGPTFGQRPGQGQQPLWNQQQNQNQNPNQFNQFEMDNRSNLFSTDLNTMPTTALTYPPGFNRGTDSARFGTILYLLCLLAVAVVTVAFL